MTTDKGPDDLSDLPLEPSSEDLEALYRQCRGKLVTANRSRSSLKGHDVRRQALITELQNQLNDLEVSLKEEASSRMRVHQLNARVAELVRDLETGLDEAAAIIEERGEAGLTTWVVRVARLLPVALRLREVKAGALRLLGRDAGVLNSALQSSQQSSEQAPALLIANDSAQDSEQLQLPLLSPESTPLTPTPPSPAAPVGGPPINLDRKKNFGPLILKDLTDAYGLLLLHIDGQTLPEGWCIQNDSRNRSGVGTPQRELCPC